MTQRPESVTVIAWLLITFGAFGLLACVTAWSMRDWPMMQPMLAAYRVPFAVIMAVDVVNIAMQLLCAVALLMRQGWARHLYLASALLTAGFSTWITTWPLFVLLPSLFLPFLATMFLYRPAANRWFAGEDVAAA